jgi:uncharacterized membrane protein YvbJ
MAEVKCIHCGEMVFETSTECPKCNKPIANPDAPTNVPDSPREWRKDVQAKDNMLPVILIGIAVAAIVLFFILR